MLGRGIGPPIRVALAKVATGTSVAAALGPDPAPVHVQRPGPVSETVPRDGARQRLAGEDDGLVGGL